MISFVSSNRQGFFLDSDNSGSINDLDAHVAFFSPLGVPGVLHNPERSSLFYTIADSKNGVIKSDDKVLVVKDSR